MKKYPGYEVLSGNENNCELLLFINQELICFQGHFPGLSVLPGITQIHWAEHFAAKLLKHTGSFCSMQKIKFKSVIQPNLAVKLMLRVDRDTSALDFIYESEAGEHSSGRLNYRLKT